MDCVWFSCFVLYYTCACVYARLRTHRCGSRTFFGVAAAGGYGYSGRRSGFGRHSALRRLIVMYFLVAATGATVPLSLSTLITGSLRYKAERGQALLLSPRRASANHKCSHAHAAIKTTPTFRRSSNVGNHIATRAPAWKREVGRRYIVLHHSVLAIPPRPCAQMCV